MLKAVSFLSPFLVIGALVGLAASGRLFAASPARLAFQLGVAGLAAWARVSFPRGSFRVMAPPGGDSVVRRGPYRLVRHPMYSAALLMVWSGIVPDIAWWPVLLGAAVTGAVVARIVFEERLLRERYRDYGEYAKTTKALIPYIA
jgi:protein-S-isoprenylcysteine O-methyltransferase Ste14